LVEGGVWNILDQGCLGNSCGLKRLVEGWV
jgi:hypothetical protein